jgi:hypothetical protein
MAVDFQCIFPQESVLLNTIQQEVIGGFAAIRVVGEDFRSVDEVVINNEPSPDVIILSKTELVAQLPDSQQLAPDISSVAVLSNRFTVTRRSLFRFRIGKRPGKVRGILRLLQLFVKILLTSPGTDIFRPGSGGGILSKVGTTFGSEEGSNLVTDFVVSVTRTQRQIIAMQARDQRSPRDERLLSATVIGSQFDKTQGALYMRIRIISQAGESAEANLEV